MTKVRKAVHADLRSVMDMFVAMVEQSPAFSHVKQSQLTLKAHAQQIIDRPKDFILLVAENKASKPTGLLLAQTAYYFGSEMRFIADVFLYVFPNSRGSNAAYRLLQALEAEAAERDMGSITFPSTGMVHDEVVDRLCKRLGYNAEGVVYRKKL